MVPSYVDCFKAGLLDLKKDIVLVFLLPIKIVRLK
jgi:hypothetical protein